MLEFARRLWIDGRTCFRGEAPRPDAIVGSSPHLFTAFVGCRLARRFDVPFVMEVRDLWPETFVAFGFWGRRHPIVVALRMLERYLYRRADRIVVLMPEAWRYITRLSGVPKERIVWIPNGAAFRRTPSSRQPWRTARSRSCTSARTAGRTCSTTS